MSCLISKHWFFWEILFAQHSTVHSLKRGKLPCTCSSEFEIIQSIYFSSTNSLKSNAAQDILQVHLLGHSAQNYLLCIMGLLKPICPTLWMHCCCPEFHYWDWWVGWEILLSVPLTILLLVPIFFLLGKKKKKSLRLGTSAQADIWYLFWWPALTDIKESFPEILCRHWTCLRAAKCQH